MAIKTQRYLRKPLYVDAVQVTQENMSEISKWCQGPIRTNDGSDPEVASHMGKYIQVRVHNPRTPKQTKAFVGDWILYTERGYKVYSSMAFFASFELVVGGEQ